MVESNLGSCFDRLLTESYALHLYPCRNKKNNRLQIWSHPLSPLILLFWKHRLFVQQIIVEAVSGWANFRSVRKRHGHDYVITRDQKTHLLQVSCVRLKTVKSHSVRALKKTNQKKIGNCCMHFAQIVWLRCEIVGFRREINQQARPVWSLAFYLPSISLKTFYVAFIYDAFKPLYFRSFLSRKKFGFKIFSMFSKAPWSINQSINGRDVIEKWNRQR